MTKRTRRKFSPEFKAKVAFEAAKNQKTLAELSQHFEVNPVTISKWKTEFLENMSSVFGGEKGKIQDEDSPEMEKLYAQIGQLKVENDFLKKSARRLGIPESEWK
jgi:transposase